jgi:hypothetical protein
MRGRGDSVTAIAQALAAAGTPISVQSVWAILQAAGHDRLPRAHRRTATRSRSRAVPTNTPPDTPPPALDHLRGWPIGTVHESDHAGVLLLSFALIDLDLAPLFDAPDRPSGPVDGVEIALLGPRLLELIAVALELEPRRPLTGDRALGLLFNLDRFPSATDRRAQLAAVWPQSELLDRALQTLAQHGARALMQSVFGGDQQRMRDLAGMPGTVAVGADEVAVTLVGRQRQRDEVTRRDPEIPWWPARQRLRVSFRRGLWVRPPVAQTAD